MIIFKSGQLNKKEQLEISILLDELIDEYSDFYLTRDNIRLYIKDNKDILFDSLQKGNYIAYTQNGIAIVDGYADNAKRKYVKILSKDIKLTDKLLTIINANIKDILFCKLKKKNPIIEVFKNNGFKFKGNRGLEILLTKENKYGNTNKQTKN